MTDKGTMAVYAERADEYATRFAKSGTDWHLQTFLDALPKGGRVLDLGCGPGQAAYSMAQAGFKVDAWDASPEMAKTGLDIYGLNIEVKGFADLDVIGIYDGIYANFSLLHAPKPEMPDHLQRIARALKTGGVFHIGLKTGKGEQRDSIGRFYAYYEDAELTALLSAVGLSVYDRQFGAGVGLDGIDAPWIIMKARRDD